MTGAVEAPQDTEKAAAAVAGSLSDDLDRLLDAARRQHRNGELYEAELGYRGVLAYRPEDPDALNLLGILALQVDQREIGIDFLRRAIAANPTVPSFHVNLGSALVAESRPEEASEAFRWALEVDPNCVDALANLATVLKRKEPRTALDLYQKALALDPDHPESHFGIAGVFRRLDQLEEAELHYRRTLELRPSLIPAYRDLARFLYLQRRFAEAAVLYSEWLRVRPGDPVATHNLAAITGADMPRASDAFVRELFDAFAPIFDEALAGLEYRAPQLIGAALHETLGSPAAALDILDLGAGTGLCGVEARPFARVLTGVDLSEKMLRLAASRGIYDELVVGELTAFVEGGAGSAFDVAVCGDTLVYFGALDRVLAGAARVLRPKGRFLFTVERSPDDGGTHRLMPFGRYQHSASYLQASLGEAGFRSTLKPVCLRKEAGEEVDGWLVIAEREVADHG